MEMATQKTQKDISKAVQKPTRCSMYVAGMLERHPTPRHVVEDDVDVGDCRPRVDELCFDGFFSQYLPAKMNCAPEAVQVPMTWQNLRGWR
ncbi:hypothetical protein CTA1_505 [Colletotrichum tanaceti]|uniref:Uncharacterized protein n=1 Tax=Colletotrichum tanaceti TaxID=1306861 RepID=A0A4U6XH26_9PEZI|nr:hypothetical protein CTA1_505 [Colletotrichum tanaceti]